MNNLRQAAQQALEALKKVNTDAGKQPPVYPWDIWQMWVDRAIILLHAALAEPEQEPVAWRLYKDGELYAIKYEKEDRGPNYTWEPLYTAPTPRKHDLEALNAELVEALRWIGDHDLSGTDPEVAGLMAHGFVYRARAALAKAGTSNG